MRYVGIQSQISSNNRKSMLLLLAFPAVILAMVWVFLAIIQALSSGSGSYDYAYGYSYSSGFDVDSVNSAFMSIAPWVVAIVGVWFVIAYFCNSSMVSHAVGSYPIERRDNPRVYNIVENLTMACGMDMPKVHIVDDPQLNAFASGINRDSYAVTLTTGIISCLNDDELSGVIGHELTHIRNHDTKLLITSIVFVGIVSTAMTMIARMAYYNFLGGRRSEKNNGVSVAVAMFVALVCCAIAYVFILLTRFAISRKREFMADAGGAELCGNPRALASALRKISANPGLDDVKREDVAQLFIMHPDEMSSGFLSSINSLFSTHPDTEERIRILEQF